MTVMISDLRSSQSQTLTRREDDLTHHDLETGLMSLLLKLSPFRKAYRENNEKK